MKNKVFKQSRFMATASLSMAVLLLSSCGNKSISASASFKTIQDLIPQNAVILDSAINDFNGDGLADIAIIVDYYTDEIFEKEEKIPDKRTLRIAFANTDTSGYSLNLERDLYVSADAGGDVFRQLKAYAGDLMISSLSGGSWHDDDTDWFRYIDGEWMLVSSNYTFGTKENEYVVRRDNFLTGNGERQYYQRNHGNPLEGQPDYVSYSVESLPMIKMIDYEGSTNFFNLPPSLDSIDIAEIQPLNGIIFDFESNFLQEKAIPNISIAHKNLYIYDFTIKDNCYTAVYDKASKMFSIIDEYSYVVADTPRWLNGSRDSMRIFDGKIYYIDYCNKKLKLQIQGESDFIIEEISPIKASLKCMNLDGSEKKVIFEYVHENYDETAQAQKDFSAGLSMDFEITNSDIIFEIHYGGLNRSTFIKYNPESKQTEHIGDLNDRW